MRMFRKIFFLFIAVFLLNRGLFAQNNEAGNFCGLPGVFESDSILNIIIFANYDSLLNDRLDKPVRRPAHIRYLDKCRTPHTINAQISVRGKFRKNPVNCDFPSLRLYFEKDSVRGTIFEGHNSIKMVVQCQTDIKDFEQYVLGEYLIYKWYQEVSPFAFRVRLIRCTYSNLGSYFPTMVQYAFLLETKGSFEKRMMGKFLTRDEINVAELDPEEYKKLCFFQYMILNNDWAATILHNTEIFDPGPDHLPVAVPFDFDFAGILGIPYRVPSATNDTILHPSRDFKGPYTKRKEVIKTIRFFNSKHKQFRKMLKDFPYFTVTTRNTFEKHLDDFCFIINFPPQRNKYIFKGNR